MEELALSLERQEPQVSTSLVEAKKVCKGCGRELPLNQFPIHRRSKDGHTGICHDCHRRRYRNTIGKGDEVNPLEKFTARQLGDELYRRGYKGELTYTEVHKFILGR